MAVGKANNQRTSKSYSVEITSKEGKVWLAVPHFTFRKKVDAEFKDLTLDQTKEAFGVEGFIRDISGNLVNVTTRLCAYEDKPIHNVVLELVDPNRDETLYAQYTIGSDLGRKLTNTILNLKTFEDVRIGLWGQKNTVTKKSYPAVSVRVGDVKETVKYFLDPKVAPELKPREYIGEGDKPKKDYTKVDAFLFAQITDFGANLSRGAQSQSPAPKQAANEETPAEPAAVAGEDDGADLPF